MNNQTFLNNSIDAYSSSFNTMIQSPFVGFAEYGKIYLPSSLFIINFCLIPLVICLGILLTILSINVFLHSRVKSLIYKYLLYNSIFDMITLCIAFVNTCTSLFNKSDEFLKYVKYIEIYLFLYVSSVTLTCSNLTKCALAFDRIFKLKGKCFFNSVTLIPHYIHLHFAQRPNFSLHRVLITVKNFFFPTESNKLRFTKKLIKFFICLGKCKCLTGKRSFKWAMISIVLFSLLANFPILIGHRFFKINDKSSSFPMMRPSLALMSFKASHPDNISYSNNGTSNSSTSSFPSGRILNVYGSFFVINAIVLDVSAFLGVCLTDVLLILVIKMSLKKIAKYQSRNKNSRQKIEFEIVNDNEDEYEQVPDVIIRANLCNESVSFQNKYLVIYRNGNLKKN
jgi:hypothetical protein